EEATEEEAAEDAQGAARRKACGQEGRFERITRARIPEPVRQPSRPNAGLASALLRGETWVSMGGTGLEPVTPSLSSWCSPNSANRPTVYGVVAGSSGPGSRACPSSRSSQ